MNPPLSKIALAESTVSFRGSGQQGEGTPLQGGKPLHALFRREGHKLARHGAWRRRRLPGMRHHVSSLGSPACVDNCPGGSWR